MPACNPPEVSVDLKMEKMANPTSALRQQVWRVVFTAENPVGMPAEIFLYEQRTRNPSTGDLGARFLGVASKSDINTYPIGAPDPELDYQFYRKSVADLEFDSQSLADEAREKILFRISNLIETIKAAACLEDPVIYHLGDA